MKGRIVAPIIASTPDFFSAEVENARRFYLNFTPHKNKGFSVICGGLEHCRTHYSINRATFPFYAVEYVVRGKGQLLLDGHHYELHSGRVFSYGPRIPHQITGSISDNLVKYFVDFTGGGSLRLLQSCGLAPGHVIQVVPRIPSRQFTRKLLKADFAARRYVPGLPNVWLLKSARLGFRSMDRKAWRLLPTSKAVNTLRKITPACGRSWKSAGNAM